MRSYYLALLIPLAACGNSDDQRPGVPGTGSGNARTFAVADFSAVALQGPDDVDVRVGAGFSVRAEGDAAELAKLRIERVGDTLRIGRVRKTGMWGSGKTVTVYVTMPRITAADLAGSGDLAIDRAESPRFAAELAGSGDLSVAALATGDAKFAIAGSGTITAAGRADRFAIDIAGSGDLDAPGLTAAAAAVSIAGSGSVRAAVAGDATVELLGSGDVDLGARARCRTTKLGSGTVRCGA